MSWSLGETKTLAVKAASGSGMSWGLAEEAGFAVHWLQRRGAPGLRALAALLEWQAESPEDCLPIRHFSEVGGPTGVLNPIELGARLIDKNQCSGSGPGKLYQPLLLAPFIATVASSRGCKLKWGEVSILLNGGSMQTSVNPEALLTGHATCCVSAINDDAFSPGRLHERVPDSEADAIARLGFFAARTYAPATESSRLAGAGAGLNDND